MNSNEHALQEEITRQRSMLYGYITHVPDKVKDGSHNLAVEFKKSVAEAARTHAKRNVKLSELNSAINNLHRYWT